MIKVRYKELNHLVESLDIYTDHLIVPESLAESWLAKNYTDNKEKTIMSVEKYVLSLLAEKIGRITIDKEKINKLVDERIKFLINNKSDYVGSLPITIKELNKIKVENDLNEGKIDLYIQDIQNVSNLLYLKSLINGNSNTINRYNVYAAKNREVIKILCMISHLLNTLEPEDERFKYLDDSISRLLYLFKDFDMEHTDIIFGNTGINFNKEEVENYTVTDLENMFKELENMMNSGSEFILDYVVEELYALNSKIMLIKKGDVLKESTFTKSDFVNEEFYLNLEERFDSLAQDLFVNDTEIESDDYLNRMVEFYNIAKTLAEKELDDEEKALNEASSRIITKGTDKVTKKIGNASAKSRGMSASNSKVGQLKRGAKIVDDRASDAINKKVDQVINITKDAKREKLITGKNTVKLGKAIKTGLAIITTSGVAKVAFGPLVGGMITAITGLSAYALSKRTEEREKKRILLELETELKITKEKIEDAKGDNARDQKYQLMRIQASLEKEIARIKHGLRYY